MTTVTLEALMTDIYYLNLQRPWQTIKLVEQCSIIECEKFTWAVDQHGAKRLLGASAFFTLPSAERAKLGALQRLVKSGAPFKVVSAARFELDNMAKGAGRFRPLQQFSKPR